MTRCKDRLGKPGRMAPLADIALSRWHRPSRVPVGEASVCPGGWIALCSAQPRTTLRGAERGAPPWTQALQVVVKPLPECGTEQQLYGFVRRQLPFGSGRQREKALGRWASRPPAARWLLPSHPRTLCASRRGAVPETFLVKRRIDTQRVRDSPPRPLGLLLPHGRALPAGSALRPAF